MCLADTVSVCPYWISSTVTIVLGSSPACDITAVMYMHANYLHFSKLTAVFEVGLTIKLLWILMRERGGARGVY